MGALKLNIFNSKTKRKPLKHMTVTLADSSSYMIYGTSFFTYSSIAKQVMQGFQ